jgi:hypothetical protein
LLPVKTLLAIIRLLAVSKVPFAPHAQRDTSIVLPPAATVAVDPIDLFLVELLALALYYCARVLLTIHINRRAYNFDVLWDVQGFGEEFILRLNGSVHHILEDLIVVVRVEA